MVVRAGSWQSGVEIYRGRHSIVIPFIDKRSNECRDYCNREQFVSVADKPTRCRSFQARAAQGKVYLPRNAPWIGDVLVELLSFPAGRTDDIADAMGLLGRLLDKM